MGGGVVQGMCSLPPLQECMHNISVIIIACTSQEMCKLYRASGGRTPLPPTWHRPMTISTETLMA